MTQIPLEVLAGVDVGGSGVRVRLQVGDRFLQARHDEALPRAGGQIDVPRMCHNVLTELWPLMAEFGVRRLDGLALGMTGLPGLVPAPVEVARGLWSGSGLIDGIDADTVAIASDALTTHLGALGGLQGGVVAAGTGVIGLGTNHQDIWQQVDGWGLFVGDEGSGAWIGRKGLQAALRALDGRSGGSAVLAEQLRLQYGDPLALVTLVHGAKAPSARLASFAPAVAQAARSGDPIARSIWRQAGLRLADTGIAAVRDLPARISSGGGLFDVGDLLIEAFCARVQEVMPAADIREPGGTALEGALLLARRAATGKARTREPYVQVFTSDAAALVN